MRSDLRRVVAYADNIAKRASIEPTSAASARNTDCYTRSNQQRRARCMGDLTRLASLARGLTHAQGALPITPFDSFGEAQRSDDSSGSRA